jgi:hypothetical protein
MAIKISGSTVIDDSLNITNANNMCVGVVTMTGTSGDIETPGTITAGGIDAPPAPASFNPLDGATNVQVQTTIVITFDQFFVVKGSGNITIRSGSSTGTIIETIAVSSGNVVISGGNIVTITPSSYLPFNTSIYVVVDSGAFLNSFNSGNALIDTYNFTTKPLGLGDPYEGGYLICDTGSVRWIVSPYAAESSLTWSSRSSANGAAQSLTGCTGWFVPSIGQLQNPGYQCRTYWDDYSLTEYWSDTANNDSTAWCLNMVTGGVDNRPMGVITCTRSFRCVTY